MNLILRCVLIVALAGLTGCGASRNAVPSPFDGDASGGSAAEDPIRIEIQNLNFNDITVWAVRQGQRIRLGRVTGKTDQTFSTEWNLALPIYFVVDVTGGRSCRTASVSVERNARVWVTVPGSVGVQPCRIGRS